MENINYCRGIIIVSKEDDYYFFEYIKTNLHLPIYIFYDNKVTIDNIAKEIKKGFFTTQSKLKRRFFVEEKNKVVVNFFVMPIIRSDSDEAKKFKYLNKKVFENIWLNQYILPIFYDKNLKDLFYELDLINLNERNKFQSDCYNKIVPIKNLQESINSIEKIGNELKQLDCTNLELFFEKCLELMWLKKKIFL